MDDRVDGRVDLIRQFAGVGREDFVKGDSYRLVSGYRVFPIREPKKMGWEGTEENHFVFLLAPNEKQWRDKVVIHVKLEDHTVRAGRTDPPGHFTSRDLLILSPLLYVFFPGGVRWVCDN